MYSWATSSYVLNFFLSHYNVHNRYFFPDAIIMNTVHAYVRPQYFQEKNSKLILFKCGDPAVLGWAAARNASGL